MRGERGIRQRGLLMAGQVAVLAVFLLVPIWYRLPAYLPIFPPLYPLRFLILLPMLIAIVSWVLAGLPGLAELRRDRPRALWALSLLLLALWAFASTNWAFMGETHPELALASALQFALVALFALTIACAGPPPRALIAALVAGLIWNGILTVAQMERGGSLGLHALGEFPFSSWQQGTSVVQAGAVRIARPYGLLPHPNLLAGALMIGLLAALAWVIDESRFRRWTSTAAFALGVYALLLTFSRAAWGAFLLSSLLALPLAWPSLRRNVRPLSIALASAFAAVILFALQYQPFLAARAGAGAEPIEMRSIADRLVFTDFALRSIGERPLQGVGAGNFPWRTSYYIAETFYELRGDQVHHVLLAAWAELGAVGLGLLLIALGTGLYAALRRPAFVDRSPEQIALIAIVFALTAVGWLEHYPYTLLHFQAAWWGCLAAAMTHRPTIQSAAGSS
ncbi:MAG: O-antigen ligase family protein [Aggregatilineales bacterium]